MNTETNEDQTCVVTFYVGFRRTHQTSQAEKLSFVSNLCRCGFAINIIHILIDRILRYVCLVRKLSNEQDRKLESMTITICLLI